MTSTTPAHKVKDFLKLPSAQKADLLHKKGLLLDSDVYKEERVNLYYIDGFFAEETINYITWELKDVVPFMSGYKIENYIKYNRKPIRYPSILCLN